MKAEDIIQSLTNILAESSVLESTVVDVPAQKYQSDEWWEDLAGDVPTMPVAEGKYLMVEDSNNLFKNPDLVFIGEDLSVLKFIKIDWLISQQYIWKRFVAKRAFFA